MLFKPRHITCNETLTLMVLTLKEPNTMAGSSARAGQYRSHLDLPFSTKPVSITITATLFSQVMRQKCSRFVVIGLDGWA